MTFSFPIRDSYKITQKFGESLLNYTPLKGHPGLDIAASTATPIMATAEGIIVYAAEDSSGYGVNIKQLVSFNEPNKFFEFIYAHLLRCEVKNGDRVVRGQTIGLMDSTGRSTGSHLHFGARILARRKPTSDEETVSHFNIDYALLEPNNGFRGYIDPLPFLEEIPESVYPVDNRYGQPSPEKSWDSWWREHTWELRHEKYARERLAKAGLTRHFDQAKKAMVYGFWDIDTVVEPALVSLYREITKPEYLKRIGKL